MLKVRDFKQTSTILGSIVHLMAKCEHDETLVMEMLQKIYVIGYAAGAVESRKLFDTDWTPPEGAEPPIDQLYEAAAEFYESLKVIHQAGTTPVSQLN